MYYAQPQRPAPSVQVGQSQHQTSRGLPYLLVFVAVIFFGGLLDISFAALLRADGIPPELANKDFANYWVSAHLAARGLVGDVFGAQPVYFTHLRAAMGPAFPWHNWSYPPHYLLLMMPLALVSYKVGLVAFLLVTGTFFVAGFDAYMGKANRLAWLAVGPFVLLNAWTVQNGFLTSGLILWFLALRDRRPVIAGICLGAMSIKPQLALLLPLVPLIERRWSVLVAATATATAMILASLLAFGTAAWVGFVADILPYQKQVMMQLGGTFLWMMPSVFGAARLVGFRADMALYLHLLLAVPSLVLTVLALLRSQSPRLPDYLVPIAIFAVTPYSLNYDMGVVSAAVALFIREQERHGMPFAAATHLLFAGAMLLPIAMMIAGRWQIVTAPLVLYGLFALMVSRAIAWQGTERLLACLDNSPKTPSA